MASIAFHIRSRPRSFLLASSSSHSHLFSSSSSPPDFNDVNPQNTENPQNAENAQNVESNAGLDQRARSIVNKAREEVQKNLKEMQEFRTRVKEIVSDLMTKERNQRVNVLSLMGGTMLTPPKEHLVEKYFHPDNMSSANKLKIEPKRVRDEFKMSETDCGSTRVQIGMDPGVGSHPEVEDLMEEVYGGSVASGDDAAAFGMDPGVGSSQQQCASLEDEMLSAFPVGEGGRPSHLAALTSLDDDSMPSSGSSEPVPSRLNMSAPSAVPVRAKRPRGQSASVTPSTGRGGGRRNTKQSNGVSLFNQHVEASLEASRALVTLGTAEASEHVATSKSPEGKAEAMKVVGEMIKEGLLAELSQMWCFAVSFLTTKANRDMFLEISSNPSRLEYLKYKYQDKHGKPYQGPEQDS